MDVSRKVQGRTVTDKDIKTTTDQAGGELSPEQSKKFWKLYRKIIKEGEIECPAPIRPEGKKKRGPLKRSKARNLLERLKDFEEDVLRFMDNEIVPFTNNQGLCSGFYNPQDSGKFLVEHVNLGLVG